jgi:hypothetical protein
MLVAELDRSEDTMIKLIYPETGLVSEQTIIGWAIDHYVNAHLQDNPELSDSSVEALIRQYQAIDITEAIAELEDSGIITIAR